MKKTIRNLLFLLLTSVVLMGSVKAATIEVGSDKAPSGAVKRSVSVDLKDEDLSDYNKVTFKISTTSSDAEILNFSFVSLAGLSFSFDTEKEEYVIESTTSLIETSLGSIYYKTSDTLSQDFQINLTDVTFYKIDGTELHSGDAGVSIKQGKITYTSNNSYLKSLSVSNYTLSPEFDKDTTQYTVQVKDTVNTVSIKATPDDAKAQIKSGTGNKTLEVGENLFEILVEAPDGSTKTYTVLVVRGEITEPSAYFKSLLIDNIGATLSPEFDPLNNKYTVKINDSIKELNFKYELEDPLATVEIEGNEDFVDGENTVRVTVKASDESEEQIYEFTVIKNVKEETPTVTEEPKEDSKDEKQEESKIWIIIIIIVVCLAILIGVVLILFRKKDNTPKGSGPLKKRTTPEDLPTPKLKDKQEELYDKHDIDALVNDTSITGMLKKELYDDDRTQKFDTSLLKRPTENSIGDLEKTKEFNFRDLDNL